MRSGTIAFLFGMLAVNSLQHLPPLTWFLPLPFILSVVYLLLRQKQQKGTLYFVIKMVVLSAIFFTFGFCYALLNARIAINQTLPKNLQRKDLLITGVIQSIPSTHDNVSKFIFKTSKLKLNSTVFNKAITARLSWYFAAKNLAVGQRWQLLVRLKRPQGFYNPGGFDFEKWLFQKGIHATGYIKKSLKNKQVNNSASDHKIDTLRDLVRSKIERQLGRQPLVGLIEALTIGVKDKITQNQWQVFRATGTSHLMAISGLHIGMIAGVAFFLMSFFWRQSSRLVLKLPTLQAAGVASLFAAIIYSAMAGFAVPTQRALIMITVFMLSILYKRNLKSWTALALALFIVLLWDPFAPMAAGFWLSFAAVATIGYGMSNRLAAKSLWWKWGRVQWVVTIGLIPLTLFLFGKASLIAIIANFIAIPWVGFIVVPLSLLGVACVFIHASWGRVILQLALWFIQMLWPILQWLASWQYAMVQIFITEIWILITGIFAILILLAPKGMPAKWLGFVFILPLFINKIQVPAMDTVRFTVLDVGQGLATVVQTQHHVLIYDAGPKFSPTFNAGSAVIIPYLHYMGIRAINNLIISHGDSDHIGGAFDLLKKMPVNKILTSAPSRFIHYQAQNCHQGQSWQWDGVHFSILYPRVQKAFKTKNNNSCVLRVSLGDKHILLTGDIEEKAENYLLKHEFKQLSAQILVAPHHGSKTSSSVPFITAIHPDYVIFGVGYQNRFGFPNSIVMKRYQKLGATLLQTDQTGAITFTLTKAQTIKPPELYRMQHGHYYNLMN